MGWHIIERDGEPPEEGVYETVAIHCAGYYKGQFGMPIFAWHGAHLFADAKHVNRELIMPDQPRKGAVWVGLEPRTASYVYAWRECERPDIELPEGVSWR